jgi:hypothetical protein
MDQLGQAEVENLDAFVLRDENILRLQITMDDPFLVRCAQPARDLQRVVQRPARREGRVIEEFAERLPLQQLRHHVRRAVVGADVVDGQNVGVVEHAGGARLLFETAQPVRVRVLVGAEDFDRHLPPEPNVLGPVHFPHPSGAYYGGDPVRPELLADQRGRGGEAAPCAHLILRRPRVRVDGAGEVQKNYLLARSPGRGTGS